MQEQDKDLLALKALAQAAKGWDWETVRGDQFGHTNEDGVFYDIGIVDADQYATTGEENYNGTVLAYVAAVPPKAILSLISRIEQAESALADMEARKDAAYDERNQVVAALAKCFRSGVARTAIEGWSEDWHGCVYIDLPTGQASWHFHDSQAHLFNGLPQYEGKWDGHDTPEKYRRVNALKANPSPAVDLSGLTHKFEEIRSLLEEAYGFKSTSPVAQRNINDALGLLTEIEVLSAPVVREGKMTDEVPEGWEPVYLVWHDDKGAWVDDGVAEYEAAEDADRRIAYQPKEGE